MIILPVLSTLIWLPILGGIALFFLKEDHRSIARSFSLGISVICTVICAYLLYDFNPATAEMQWTELRPWLPAIGLHYSLGVDGFSLPLIALTCFMTLLVILASYHSMAQGKRLRFYLALFLIMQGLMCGAFAAVDAILFYIFWESMLIPMFLIIGIWGSDNRIYATIKFFLYTFLGSVLLLVGLIYLHFQAINQGIEVTDSFDILVFHHLPLTFIEQKWLFIALLIAFAVKVPMWPVHTWLPDAHVEAPAGGSVILAAILLKMGGYAMLRFLLPIAPDASQALAGVMVTLSLIAIVYIALVAIVQRDMKKLIAYSSISHMGFVTLGLFVAFFMSSSLGFEDKSLGIQGGMVQMISHGFVSAALFLCVGVLYDRLHSRLIQDYGGVVNSMPTFAAFFMLFAMANVGLPGTSGFVGEFMVILSAFKAKLLYAVFAASILILGAAYTLWMYKRVIFGPAANASILALQDLVPMEKLMFTLLAIAVIVLGIWPEPLLQLMQATSQNLVQQMLHSKL